MSFNSPYQYYLLEETNMAGLRRVCDIPISLPTVQVNFVFVFFNHQASPWEEGNNGVSRSDWKFSMSSEWHRKRLRTCMHFKNKRRLRAWEFERHKCSLSRRSVKRKRDFKGRKSSKCERERGRKRFITDFSLNAYWLQYSVHVDSTVSYCTNIVSALEHTRTHTGNRV